MSSRKHWSLIVWQKAAHLCPHHVGHYLGMDVHDVDKVTRSVKLMPDTIVTIEPGERTFVHCNTLIGVVSGFLLAVYVRWIVVQCLANVSRPNISGTVLICRLVEAHRTYMPVELPDGISANEMKLRRTLFPTWQYLQTTHAEGDAFV